MTSVSVCLTPRHDYCRSLVRSDTSTSTISDNGSTVFHTSQHSLVVIVSCRCNYCCSLQLLLWRSWRSYSFLDYQLGSEGLL